MNSDEGVKFLQWALPELGYSWQGFRKPRGQVLKRIQNRMHELGLSSGFDEYRYYLENHPQEWNRLDSFCYVTISKFFRDRKLWDFLQEEVFQELFRDDEPAPLRIWSAGCCNGEEPYTIGILIEELPEDVKSARQVSILASDRYSEILKRAKQGRYPSSALKELTNKELENYFDKIENGNEDYQIRKEPSRYVEFEVRDIRKSLPDGTFQLVFCRNLVFTYFRKDQRKQFLEKLKPKIKPGGYLVTGSNEQLPDNDWLKKTVNTHPVFQKTGD